MVWKNFQLRIKKINWGKNWIYDLHFDRSCSWLCITLFGHRYFVSKVPRTNKTKPIGLKRDKNFQTFKKLKAWSFFTFKSAWTSSNNSSNKKVSQTHKFCLLCIWKIINHQKKSKFFQFFFLKILMFQVWIHNGRLWRDFKFEWGYSSSNGKIEKNPRLSLDKSNAFLFRSD